MLGRARNVNATAKRVAAKTTFTMRHLWRQAMWGSAAVVALLVAILTSFTDTGSQRVATILSSLNLAPSSSYRSAQAGSQAAKHTLDPETAVRQLAQAVRGLGEDRDRMMTRLASLERNMDDMTGSITQQIEAAKAAAAQAPSAPWPSESSPAPAAPASVEFDGRADCAATGRPSVAVAAEPRDCAAAEQPASDAAAPAPSPAYGADIGNGASIKALRARWAEMRAAHAEIFDGLQPVVKMRDNARLQSNRTAIGGRAIRQRRWRGAAMCIACGFPAFLPADYVRRPASRRAMIGAL